MKALRFHAAKDLRIEEIAAIPAPGPGQVAIRNRFVGICGTDLHEYAYGPIFIPTPMARRFWGTSSAASSPQLVPV